MRDVCSSAPLLLCVQRNHISPHKRLWRALGGRRVQRHIAAVNVEEFGCGALLRLAHGHILARQQLGNLRVGVVHIPGDDRVLRANNHARRLQADIGAVGAVVALGGRFRLRVDVDGVVRAGLHARLAADADAVVELHDAVGALVHRFRGADAHAGRVGAVVAARHLEMATRVGVTAGFHVFDPGAVDAEGHFVFAFAGGGAGVAADALAIIDDKAEVGETAVDVGVGL